jgi:hypothetical protein
MAIPLKTKLRDFRKQLVAAEKGVSKGVRPDGTFEGVDLESESQ